MLWSRFARLEWFVDMISKAFWHHWMIISKFVIVFVFWYLFRYSISKTSNRFVQFEWFVDVISRTFWKTLNDYFKICHCFYFSIFFSIFNFKIFKLICLICWHVNKWSSNYFKIFIETIHIDNITNFNWILCYNLCHRMKNYIIKQKKKSQHHDVYCFDSIFRINVDILVYAFKKKSTKMIKSLRIVAKTLLKNSCSIWTSKIATIYETQRIRLTIKQTIDLYVEHDTINQLINIIENINFQNVCLRIFSFDQNATFFNYFVARMLTKNF